MASTERIMVIDCQMTGLSGDMVSETMAFVINSFKGCANLQTNARTGTLRGTGLEALMKSVGRLDDIC